MTHFKNLRDGRQDGRQGANDNEQAPKRVRTSLASRLSRSLRRRMPSNTNASSREAPNDENEHNVVSVMRSITPTVEPIARPRRRSVIDRRASNSRHPYSYRRSEYLNDLQAVFVPPALSPNDTVINPPAEILADLLQVELQPYDRKYSLNRRLDPEAQQEYVHEISFFDYDFKNEREDSNLSFASVVESSPGRETGFRMIYPLSDEETGSVGDRSSWFSEYSSASDSDSQGSSSPRGSQLSIIRAASLASLKN